MRLVLASATALLAVFSVGCGDSDSSLPAETPEDHVRAFLRAEADDGASPCSGAWLTTAAWQEFAQQSKAGSCDRQLPDLADAAIEDTQRNGRSAVVQLSGPDVAVRLGVVEDASDETYGEAPVWRISGFDQK